MTYEPWKDDSILIRFEHLLEKNEDPELSKPARFNLNDVFPGNDIDLKEVSLSGNQWIEDFGRLHFKAESQSEYFTSQKDSIKYSPSHPVKDSEITLNPMEIRTFIMTLTPRV
jgi:lysosomal alpha-mannosidase